MTRHGTAGFHRVRRSHFSRPAAFSARRCRTSWPTPPTRGSCSASSSASMSAACWSGPNRSSGLSLSPKPRSSAAAGPRCGRHGSRRHWREPSAVPSGWFPCLRRAAASEFCAHAACLASRPRLELGATAAVRSARIALRRGGRVVECTALEMRHRCKPIGGSNPLPLRQ